MNQELLKSVLRIKHKKKFQRFLDSLDKNQIQTLYECFDVVKQQAQSTKEKLIVAKYEKIIKASKRHRHQLRRAKAFLYENFPIVKKIVGTVLSCASCLRLTSCICENER